MIQTGSASLEAVAKIEGRGGALTGRLLEESRVDASERIANSRVGPLDRHAALRQRETGELHTAEAVARSLGVFEQRHVDLDLEDLVHAAHVARTRALIVVEVEVGAARFDAARWVNYAIAERTALAAFA